MYASDPMEEKAGTPDLEHGETRVALATAREHIMRANQHLDRLENLLSPVTTGMGMSDSPPVTQLAAPTETTLGAEVLDVCMAADRLVDRLNFLCAQVRI